MKSCDHCSMEGQLVLNKVCEYVPLKMNYCCKVRNWEEISLQMQSVDMEMYSKTNNYDTVPGVRFRRTNFELCQNRKKEKEFCMVICSCALKMHTRIYTRDSQVVQT